MLALINVGVIFAFGLVIAGVVFLGVIQARELAGRQAKVASASRNNLAARRAG